MAAAVPAFDPRRRALERALRHADPLFRASSAARLRIWGPALAPHDADEASRSRGALGRALRGARLRRATPDLRAMAAARVDDRFVLLALLLARHSRSRRKLVATLLCATVIALLVVPWWNGGGLSGADPETLVVSDPLTISVSGVSRGRVAEGARLPAVVAVATPVAGPTITPLPQIPFTGGKENNGGSGNGGIFPPPSAYPPPPPPAPVPTIAPPPPLVPGFTRLTVFVYDLRSGSPLALACIVIGSVTCDPHRPHTDGQGRWYVDVPASSTTTNWDVRVFATGFASMRRTVATRNEQEVVTPFRLLRG